MPVLYIVTTHGGKIHDQVIGVVLAAGRGKRMRPLTNERPKALLPTLDVPQLGWALARLGRAGVQRVWVNAHSQPEQIFRYAEGVAERLGMSLMGSREVEAPLGTAGALAKLSKSLTETFVVVNADVATDAPMGALVDAHTSAGSMATLLVVKTEDDADFALEEGWVIDLVDRSEQLRSGHRYAGIGVFEPEVLDFIPKGPSGVYETVFKRLAEREGTMATLEWHGYWLDVGTPSAHLTANLDALSGTLDTSVTDSLVRRPNRRDEFGYAGERSRIDDVVMRHTVVGHDAEIAPGSRLERCVVWDSALISRGSYRDSILTGRQSVRIG